MRNLGLIVTLWLASIAMPTSSLALGLGEIEVNSFLNQPLNAEIPVISARAGEIDDLLVSLASREAFTRAGLERPRHLTELRFAVRKNEEGDKAVILVSTKTAVKEPFLNFLIEADWSKGRVLREFTVLLDPPFYADTPAPAAVASEAAPAPAAELTVSEILEQSPELSPTQSDQQITEPIALSQVSSEDSSSSTGSGQAAAVEAPEPLIEGEIEIFKGDTLWSIASRYKSSEHSMAQVMLAFQRRNPQAFNNANINNLKVGAVLRAPNRDEINALSKQEAYARVLEQNGLWDDYVARVSGVAPSLAADGSATGGQSQSGGASSGELSLLLPGEGDTSSSGISDSADLSELRTKLAMAEEELDASRVENRELESRISELQARLSKVEELQKMVQIEDDSLAQLQADQVATESVVEEVNKGEDGEETDTVTPLSEEMKADEEALLEELLAEEAAAQAQEQAIIDGSMLQPESEAMVEEPVAGDDTMVEQASSENNPPPAPVIVTEPASGSMSMLDGLLPSGMLDMVPSMDGIFGDPIILGAIGGVILLLLGLFVLKRRKASSDDESSITASVADDMFAGDDEEELTPIHLAEAAEDTNIKLPTAEDMAEPVLPEDEDDEFSSTAIISRSDMPEPEAPAAADQDDVLNEVDVYLAYGLYDNAEDLLKSNLTENPERADYRSKLLDTYFATKNVDAFVAEAQSLKSMGDSASRYWDRVQVMGYELAPDNALFSDAKDSGLSAADLEIAKPQAADFDLGGADEDDTNFSTTDFNLGEEAGEDLSQSDTFADTQLSSSDDLPSLDEDDDTNVRADAEVEAEPELELPDDIGDELEFALDDGEEGDSLDIEMPDDLDLGADDASVETDDDATEAIELDDELSMAFDIDEESESEGDISEIDFGAELESSQDDDGELEVDEDDLIPFDIEDEDDDEDAAKDDFEQTAVVDSTKGIEATAVMDLADLDVMDGDDEKSSLDLGMDDTSLMDATDGDDDEVDDDDVVLELGDDETDDDISIVDFGGDDFSMDGDDQEDDDSFSIDVDVDESGDEQTGTFAPGDFEEPTEAVEALADIDDIGDLMLPDDVDEVSTKLDLARAFIDMGDTEGARGSLEEVMSEGNDEQKAEAKTLLDQI